MAVQGYWSWFGSVRQWHWMSSAVCLVGILMFSITGITLNHAAQIKVKPDVTTSKAQVPDSVLQQLPRDKTGKAPLPAVLADWLETTQSIQTGKRDAEWSEDEIYLSLPRPGGDSWLSIDRASGELLYEVTDRGWISFFNDLHKGRNTGAAWSGFLDIFAVACIIFSLTGLVLLHRYSAGRMTTWPLVGLGLVVPWVLVLLFIH